MQERFDLLQLFLTVFMMLDAVFDAGAQMIAEDICVRLADQRVDRQQLIRNIHTVAALLHHPDHRVHLSARRQQQPHDLLLILIHRLPPIPPGWGFIIRIRHFPPDVNSHAQKKKPADRFHSSSLTRAGLRTAERAFRSILP